MSPADARVRILVALMSDDTLVETLVLKGGSALSLVHGIGDRASLDLDFSLEQDLSDVDSFGGRIRAALTAEFARYHFDVIDFVFSRKPNSPRPGTPEWWGGYRAEFKLIEQSRRAAAKSPADMRNRALVIADGVQNRTFSIDISKHEWTAGKITSEIDGFRICLYSEVMIVAEKIRAICQQMPSYILTGGSRRARSRDFYDIHAVVAGRRLDLRDAAVHELVRCIFEAKQVPLQLIGRIGDQDVYDFHVADWKSVDVSTSARLEDFRFYFEFLQAEIVKLEPLWKEHSPV